MPASDDPFHRRPYAAYLAGRFCGTLATTAQSTVLGWEVTNRARDTMDVTDTAFLVGMLGLVQFLPLMAFTLPAGAAADRSDRRRILIVCFLLMMLIAVQLAGHAAFGAGLWPVFVLAGLFGCVRAFFQPSAASLGPMLVPLRVLPRAIVANTMTFQLGMVLGPALGGMLCAESSALGYVVSAGLYAVAAVCGVLVGGPRRTVMEPGASRTGQIREGLVYIWVNKTVFGAITLDLFAVLLGGATALLPMFARDVLHIGPGGFGLLRAAPAAGAMLVAAALALRPIRRHIGWKMLAAVALFGVATIVFGLSENLVLSVAALAVLGGADMVSVFARQSLVQLSTPDRMRGRVAAVSTLFIGASNELGEFESGVAAKFLGPVAAVAWGGVASVGITGIWAGLFPSLRKADRLRSEV